LKSSVPIDKVVDRTCHGYCAFTAVVDFASENNALLADSIMLVVVANFGWKMLR